MTFGVFVALFYGGAELVKPAAVAPTSTAIPGTPTPTPEPGAPVTVHLVAKNILFNVRTITVPVDAEVTLILDNQDAGVPHNFALYTDSSTRTLLFVGPIFTGIETREYDFRGPASAGSYFFRCDVHPDTMTGAFIVVAAESSPKSLTKDLAHDDTTTTRTHPVVSHRLHLCLHQQPGRR